MYLFGGGGGGGGKEACMLYSMVYFVIALQSVHVYSVRLHVAIF